jgi:hypothetical protein
MSPIESIKQLMKDAITAFFKKNSKVPEVFIIIRDGLLERIAENVGFNEIE